MNKQLDIFLIHGVGRELTKDYYNKFVSGIRNYLPLDVDIVWHGVNYSLILEKREKEIYKWLERMVPWWDITGRKEIKFATDYVCDVLAYGYPQRPPKQGDFIFDLHEELTREYEKSRPNAKRLIIGHSLGSIVGYGFTWQKPIDCLITMGSPMSLFSVRYTGGGEMNPNLPQFHNFWTTRDRVASIVSANPRFRDVKDYQVHTLNPRYWLRLQAHSMYWTSDFVHEKIAGIIQAL